MKQKIFLIITLLLVIFTLSGCDKTAKTMEGEDAGQTINPLSPESMVETYETSKGKINKAVEKQNENINKALEEAGMTEEEL